jgi:hypothetical protein
MAAVRGRLSKRGRCDVLTCAKNCKYRQLFRGSGILPLRFVPARRHVQRLQQSYEPLPTQAHRWCVPAPPRPLPGPRPGPVRPGAAAAGAWRNRPKAHAAQAAAPRRTGAATATSGQAATGGKVQSVNVVGERETNRIDRQVYDVKSDVSSSNGSAADALGNVPSVGVDPDGTVSLRGNTNVQILVDGKPSAMLQGDNRGPALQAMPAEDIDSIEVINNPGAEFGNEGGGGPILNLVMKRSRRPGGFGVVNANLRHRRALQLGPERPVQHRPLGCAGWRQRAPRRPRLDEANRSATASIRAPASIQHSRPDQSSTGLNDSAGAARPADLQPGPGRHAGSERRLHEAQTTTTQGQTATSRWPTTARLQRLPAYSTKRTATTPTRPGARAGTTRARSWANCSAWTCACRTATTSNDERAINDYLLFAPPSLIRAAVRGDATSLQERPRSKVRIVDYTGDYERPLESGASSSSATRSDRHRQPVRHPLLRHRPGHRRGARERAPHECLRRRRARRRAVRLLPVEA